jgi:hypothetical protein
MIGPSFGEVGTDVTPPIVGSPSLDDRRPEKDNVNEFGTWVLVNGDDAPVFCNVGRTGTLAPAAGACPCCCCCCLPSPELAFDPAD